MSHPSYGHLLWKIRVLLRREDVFQHLVVRRLPAWQQPYLKHSSVVSLQRKQEALGGRRMEGFRVEHRVPPPLWAWCRAAVGGQELPWAVAMLPILPTCEMSQEWACCCCVQDVRRTHWSFCAFCPFFTSWEKSAGVGHCSAGSLRAANCEQLQLQRGLGASSLVSLSLLSWKHKVGIWMDPSCCILFFCLLATFLLFLFFHSGALFCPGLVFGFSFPCILAIWFLNTSCSSFGFCCSCHLAHLQDKRKKAHWGFPSFSSPLQPLWEALWAQEPSLCTIGATVAAGDRAVLLGHPPALVQGRDCQHLPQLWVPLLSLASPKPSGFAACSLPANNQVELSADGTRSMLPLSNLIRSLFSIPGCQVSLWHLLRSSSNAASPIGVWTSGYGQRAPQPACVHKAPHFLRMVFVIALSQPDVSLPSCRRLCWVHGQPTQADLCPLVLSKTGFAGSLKIAGAIIINNDKIVRGIRELKLKFIHSQIPKLLLCGRLFFSQLYNDLKWLWAWISAALDSLALMRFLWLALSSSSCSSCVINETIFSHIMPWHYGLIWPKISESDPKTSLSHTSCGRSTSIYCTALRLESGFPCVPKLMSWELPFQRTLLWGKIALSSHFSKSYSLRKKKVTGLGFFFFVGSLFLPPSMPEPWGSQLHRHQKEDVCCLSSTNHWPESPGILVNTQLGCNLVIWVTGVVALEMSTPRSCDLLLSALPAQHSQNQLLKPSRLPTTQAPLQLCLEHGIHWRMRDCSIQKLKWSELLTPLYLPKLCFCLFYFENPPATDNDESERYTCE